MIELMARKNRDERRQIAYIRVDGQDFSVGNVPAGLDDKGTLDHLNCREDEIRLVMLRKTYPEADVSAFKKENKSELQAFQDWIVAGCINKVQIGQDEEGKPILKDIKVEAKPLSYKIPKDALIGQAIDGAKTLAELKAVLKNFIMP